MRPIPVPGQGGGFVRFAADEEEQLAVPVAPFPFWRYVGLSVTAGLITHALIRLFDRKKKQPAFSPRPVVFTTPQLPSPAFLPAFPPIVPMPRLTSGTFNKKRSKTTKRRKPR